MKKAFLFKIKNILLSERDEILQKHSQVIDIDSDGDEIDISQAQLIANIHNLLTSRDQLRLKGIDVALNKISEGSFGVCEGCGDSISEKRLVFNPLFLNCVLCAEALEIENKRNRRA